MFECNRSINGWLPPHRQPSLITHSWTVEYTNAAKWRWNRSNYWSPISTNISIEKKKWPLPLNHVTVERRRNGTLELVEIGWQMERHTLVSWVRLPSFCFAFFPQKWLIRLWIWSSECGTRRVPPSHFPFPTVSNLISGSTVARLSASFVYVSIWIHFFVYTVSSRIKTYAAPFDVVETEMILPVELNTASQCLLPFSVNTFYCQIKS